TKCGSNRELMPMPIHHPASLHHCETSKNPRVRITQTDADHIMRPAKTRVTTGERLQGSAVQHAIAIEMCPIFLLSPTKVTGEIGEDIGRYESQPKRLRIEMELLDYPRPMLQQRILDLEPRQSPPPGKSELRQQLRTHLFVHFRFGEIFKQQIFRHQTGSVASPGRSNERIKQEILNRIALAI